MTTRAEPSKPKLMEQVRASLHLLREDRMAGSSLAMNGGAARYTIQNFQTHSEI